MHALLFIAAAVFLFGSGHVAYALSAVSQITTTNIQSSYSFITIKTEDAEAGCKRFRVIITPRGGVKPDYFRGHLSIYRDGKLIVQCAVPSGKLPRKSKYVAESMRDGSVVFEFVVSSDHIVGSKFATTEQYPDMPSFEGYWFYLADFTNTK